MKSKDGWRRKKCKRCHGTFKTKAKYGKICPNCHKGTGKCVKYWDRKRLLE